MQVKRHNARELVIKALFAYEIERGDPFRQLEYITADWEMAGFDEGKLDSFLSCVEDDYARRLTSGILAHKTELDEIIGDYSLDWDIDRLGGAERNILRMGLYEMLYDEKLPPAIAINEAVDLIKKYGSPEAARFVNGILGRKAEELKI
jgi:N utilization substance protein B